MTLRKIFQLIFQIQVPPLHLTVVRGVLQDLSQGSVTNMIGITHCKQILIHSVILRGLCMLVPAVVLMILLSMKSLLDRGCQ